MTENMLILPSANLHQKYAGFFSLSLQVRLQVYGLRFPKPHDSKNHIWFVPLSLMPRNILILPSASLHRKYVGFVSLSLVDQ